MSTAVEVKSGRAKHWLQALWTGFLAACLLEALVFSMVDPGELHWPGHLFAPSRKGVYTMAFFAFWAISVACTALALWLSETDGAVSGRPAD
ncbi:MAG: hypothetical protein V4731_19520 [Pseudomonadota bacterium]